MKIAILGAGSVGGTLGKAWANQGHQVTFGVRNPESEKTQTLLQEIGNHARATTVADASSDAEVVVLATPWQAAQQAIESCEDLSGKILIDCTNPLTKDFSLALGFSTSGGEQVAEWAKGTFVYKAFNQTGWENMANPVVDGRQSVMFVCGDDQERKQIVLNLASEVGFDAIDAGPLSSARLLEPYALLWIKLAVVYSQGRNFAFGLLRR